MENAHEAAIADEASGNKKRPEPKDHGRKRYTWRDNFTLLIATVGFLIALGNVYSTSFIRIDDFRAAIQTYPGARFHDFYTYAERIDKPVKEMAYESTWRPTLNHSISLLNLGNSNVHVISVLLDVQIYQTPAGKKSGECNGTSRYKFRVKHSANLLRPGEMINVPIEFEDENPTILIPRRFYYSKPHAHDLRDEQPTRIAFCVQVQLSSELNAGVTIPVTFIEAEYRRRWTESPLSVFSTYSMWQKLLDERKFSLERLLRSVFLSPG